MIVLYSFPYILYYFLSKKKYPAYQYKWPAIVMDFILSLCLFMVTILFASIGSNSGRYKFQFEFNTATETFGLLTSMHLNGHRNVSLVVDSQQIE